MGVSRSCLQFWRRLPTIQQRYRHFLSRNDDITNHVFVVTILAETYKDSHVKDKVLFRTVVKKDSTKKLEFFLFLIGGRAHMSEVWVGLAYCGNFWFDLNQD